MLSDTFRKIGVIILSIALLLGVLSVCVSATGSDSGQEPDGEPAPGEVHDTGDTSGQDGEDTGDAEDADVPGDGGIETPEDPEDGQEPETPPEPEYVPPTLKGADGVHPGYIAGYEDGSFRPDRTVTRCEAAAMLYGLIQEPGEERAELSDVPEDAYYLDAMEYLAALGVIEVSEDGAAAPAEDLARGEFAAMIVKLMLGPDAASEAETVFTDVPEDHKYAAEIDRAAAMGWVSGIGGGLFAPERPVTRAEAVTVINKVLGGAPDQEYLAGFYFSPFSDVFSTHWAYYNIIEASLSHAHGEDGKWISGDTGPLKRPEGLYFTGLDFYCIGADGNPLRNAYSGYLYFGADGLYTSGDTFIDSSVKAVLSEIVTPEMTSLEKLRAAYLYTRDSFTYLTRNYYATGATGWDIQEATTMFSTKRGNCYCYASVFEFLARQLGYDALAVAGRCSPDNPHGWVEIVMDGTRYMFDTELEMAHRKQGRNTNLYMIPWDELPWRYWR